MNGEENNAIIGLLRDEDIIGKCVILRPASKEYSPAIVALRNRASNRYWFNQKKELTIEEQDAWFDQYENSDDDIYWCVLNRGEEFVGTIRLYHIDLDERKCEEGSYIIDDRFTKEAPYAIDAKIQALNVAFERLGLFYMINDNRADNNVMNNIDDQLGFDQGNIIQIRSVDYRHRILMREAYFKNRDKFMKIVDYWSKR